MCKQKIKNICCNSAIAHQRKHSLLHWLRYSPFRKETRENMCNDIDLDNESVVSCNESETKEFSCHEKNYYPYRIEQHAVVPISSRSSVDTNYLIVKYLK